MKQHRVYFQPPGQKGQCPANSSLLSCARQSGMGILGICSGQGKCHSCKIQVVKGTASEPTTHELGAFSAQEIDHGWRLACQTLPTSDCELNVPPGSMTTTQRLQVEGMEVTARPEPVVRAYQVKLPPPSLSDMEADTERLLEALAQQYQERCHHIDITVQQDTSTRLRSWNWQVQALVRGQEVIALQPSFNRQLGLAIDLGSTKLVAYLVDLGNGHTLAVKGVMNPQISYGEDIVSRITQVIRKPSLGKHLQEITVAALNQLAAELYDEVNVAKEEVVDAVIVGNTAMHHLLLRLSLSQLASAPFVPTVSGALDIKARDIGLGIASGAYVHLLPNIAGFVGADHVAMLLATSTLQSEGLVIALDIGTNTEVSIISNGEISSVSCASGPAFEGGHIKNGMRASAGAIERVRLIDKEIQYQTVNGDPPVGICGSGVLDIMAQLYLTGVLNEGGRMMDNHPRVRVNENLNEFVLVSEVERGGQAAIVLTQQDVREIQLAKGAIRAGIQVLLEANDRSEEEIGQVIIAGAFGSYIDISSAITIGMLPVLPVERYRQVGNAAGTGARLALFSAKQRAEAQAMASQIHYVELATAPAFMPNFIQANYLGRFRLAHGERKEIC